MTIEIPDDIADDFLNLLDVAQSSFTEDDVERFHPMERKCLDFVNKLLGDRASMRFESERKKAEATASLCRILRGI